MNIDIAFSSCPNDTFIFHGMLHGCIDTGAIKFKPYVSDIENLNLEAFKETYTVSKLSFHAYLLLREKYEILDSGAALGYGCGPMLVAGENSDKKPVEEMKIAIPGEYTTAGMLLKLWNPEVKYLESVRFDNIMDGVVSGKYDAGLIIHEGRFVYRDYGLISLIDLGDWWERETGMPIPLGCIAIKRNADNSLKKNINRILRSSVEYAFNNRNASSEYVKSYAKELDEDVIKSHIDLYVNDFSVDLGVRGREAISVLEKMAKSRGLI